MKAFRDSHPLPFLIGKEGNRAHFNMGRLWPILAEDPLGILERVKREAEELDLDYHLRLHLITQDWYPGMRATDVKTHALLKYLGPNGEIPRTSATGKSLKFLTRNSVIVAPGKYTIGVWIRDLINSIASQAQVKDEAPRTEESSSSDKEQKQEKISFLDKMMETFRNIANTGSSVHQPATTQK